MLDSLLSHGSYDPFRAHYGADKGVPSPFQALVKKGKSVAIPIQNFDMGAGFIQKNENIARNGVFFQVIPDNSGQSIEAISDVDGAATQKVTQIGAQFKHLTFLIHNS